MTTETGNQALFDGAIDLSQPIGSANLRIRVLEAEAGRHDSDQWRGTLDPFSWYAEKRAAGDGIHRDPTIGMWMVFRYPDVQHVLSDAATFSSQYGNLGMQNVDPPRHRQLRLLVTHAFTPKRVESLKARIGEIADQLIDNFAEAGEADLVKDFTQPLSTTVIAELLGIPSDDHSAFRRWTQEVSLGAVRFKGREAAAEAPQQMAAYFSDMITEAKRRPRQDLISALLEARVDGDKLTDADIFNFCVLLLVAGNETTGNLIGNTVRLLSEHPDVRDEIRSDRALMKPALEEVLRYRGPLQSMLRLAPRGATLGEHTLEPGDFVLGFIGSANRDPKVFDDPERFDIHRKLNRHIAFGHGGHFCLGAALARMETMTAIWSLMDRLGDVDVAVAQSDLQVLNSRVFYGMAVLPVSFKAKAAV